MKKTITIILLNLSFLASFAQSNDSISRKAFQCFINKEYPKADSLYGELLKANAISEKELYTLGRVYFAQHKFLDAIKVFNDLAAKSDTSYKASFWLANSYYSADSTASYSNAKPFFEKFIKKAIVDTVRNSKELYHSYYFFCCYYYSKKINFNKDSVKYFANKMLSITPSNKKHLLKAYKILMLSYARKFEIDSARYFAQKVFELDSSDTSLKFLNSLKSEFPKFK